MKVGNRNSRVSCCVVGCANRYLNTERSVKFYSFPAKPHEIELRKQWILSVCRKNDDKSLWQPTKWSRICSQHFIGNKKSNHPHSPSYIPSVFPKVYKNVQNTNFLEEATQPKRARFERPIKENELVVPRGSKEPVIDCEEVPTASRDFCSQVNFSIDNNNESFVFDCTHIDSNNVAMQANCCAGNRADLFTTNMEGTLSLEGHHEVKKEAEEDLYHSIYIKEEPFQLDEESEIGKPFNSGPEAIVIPKKQCEIKEEINNLFECVVCAKKFTRKSQLTAHARIHTPPNVLAPTDKTRKKVVDSFTCCEICDFRSTQEESLKNHYLKCHADEKPFVCYICDFKTLQKQCLKDHLEVHIGQKKFDCEICAFKCSMKQTLKRHMITHIGVESFSCRTCSYKCLYKQTLKKHMRTHFDENPFACTVCDFKSSYKQCLGDHLKIHYANESIKEKLEIDSTTESVRDHFVEVEIKESVELPTREVLKDPLEIQSKESLKIPAGQGQKKFACELCGFKCTASKTLKLHMISHIGGESLSCEICSYKCLYTKSLKRHMRTHADEMGLRLY